MYAHAFPWWTPEKWKAKGKVKSSVYHVGRCKHTCTHVEFGDPHLCHNDACDDAADAGEGEEEAGHQDDQAGQALHVQPTPSIQQSYTSNTAPVYEGFISSDYYFEPNK